MFVGCPKQSDVLGRVSSGIRDVQLLALWPPIGSDVVFTSQTSTPKRLQLIAGHTLEDETKL
jgi:hypothetical protein